MLQSFTIVVEVGGYAKVQFRPKKISLKVGKNYFPIILNT